MVAGGHFGSPLTWVTITSVFNNADTGTSPALHCCYPIDKMLWKNHEAFIKCIMFFKCITVSLYHVIVKLFWMWLCVSSFHLSWRTSRSRPPRPRIQPFIGLPCLLQRLQMKRFQKHLTWSVANQIHARTPQEEHIYINTLSRSHCPDFLGYLKKLHLVSVCSGDLPSTQEACAFASELKMRTLNCFCNQLRYFRKSQMFSFRGVLTPPPCLHWSYAALRRWWVPETAQSMKKSSSLRCDGMWWKSSPTLVGASCDWVCVPNNEPEGDSLRNKNMETSTSITRFVFFGWKKYLWYCWNLPHVDLLQKRTLTIKGHIGHQVYPSTSHLHETTTL